MARPSFAKVFPAYGSLGLPALAASTLGDIVGGGAAGVAVAGDAVGLKRGCWYTGADRGASKRPLLDDPGSNLGDRDGGS